jgi:hypothetical protein
MTTVNALLWVGAALAFVAVEHYLGLFPGQSARWLRGIGKGFGSLAATLAVVSVVYYLWRVSCGALKKRGVIRPAAAGQFVPALPGATKTCATPGERASAQASACSRPPAPITRTRNSPIEPLL